MDTSEKAVEDQKKVIASVLDYASTPGRSVIFAFVDEQGESGTMITPDKSKFIFSLGDSRHAGFLKQLSTLLTVVFASKKAGTVN